MRWEVTTAGSTAGEQVRIKQIAQETIARLTDIGLMPEQHEQLNGFRKMKQGVFIVSGPKKSGVTTTLYTLLRNHDAFINSINTLERQPSGQLPNITQNTFTLSDTGTTTFAKRLQTAVRMGPDIVGVAECEDAETAQIACAAAKDGKLMYVTLQADSVIQALGKWLKFVGDRRLVTETLLAQATSDCSESSAKSASRHTRRTRSFSRSSTSPPKKQKRSIAPAKSSTTSTANLLPAKTAREQVISAGPAFSKLSQ